MRTSVGSEVSCLPATIARMQVLALTVVLLVLTWLHEPVGGGFIWDLLNAIGFVALAACGALHVDAPVRDAGPMRSVRDALRHHTALAWTALALVVVHAVGFVMYDPVLLEYLKPGAPAYMLAGLVALALLGVIVWSARLPRRRRLFSDARRFRLAHRALAAALVGLSVWHVAGSGFYLNHAVTIALLVAVAATWVAAPQWLRTILEQMSPPIGQRVAVTGLVGLAVLHSALRNF
jgi:hypothetical protein